MFLVASILATIKRGTATICMFKDRNDAGVQLAKKLVQYREGNAVVLALPRGGVVTGYAVARALKLPLDIVVVRKIGHPFSPEYAICAADEKGMVLCNEKEAASVDQQWLKAEIQRQRQEAQRRITAYRGKRKAENLAGKIAIIVDDGVATGLTIRLAGMSVRAQNPARVVVAVPVASEEAARDLGKAADELVLLESPENFLSAVGAHYEEFEQVEDDEVIRLLKESAN